MTIVLAVAVVLEAIAGYLGWRWLRCELAASREALALDTQELRTELSRDITTVIRRCDRLAIEVDDLALASKPPRRAPVKKAAAAKAAVKRAPAKKAPARKR